MKKTDDILEPKIKSELKGESEVVRPRDVSILIDHFALLRILLSTSSCTFYLS